jgi:hypothetical protein
MRPRWAALLLASFLASGAGSPAGAPPTSPHAYSPNEHLKWRHSELDLYLERVGKSGERNRFELCVRLKRDADRAWATVGYPRYRAASGPWYDAVSGGLRRGRTVEASRETTDRACFHIIVPAGAAAIQVALDDRPVVLDVGAWNERLSRAEPGEPPRVPLADPPVDRAVLPPAPGLPASLRTELRWEGDKPFDDGALDAGERGELLVEISNDGRRSAAGVRVRISPEVVPGVTFPSEVAVPGIVPGGSVTVRVPFEAGPAAPSGTRSLIVETTEPYGHDASPIDFELTTRSAPLPELVLTDDFAVEGRSTPIPRDSIVTLRLRARNLGPAPARGVVAEIVAGDGVFAAHDSPARFELGDLAPGEVAEIPFRCYANQRAEQLSLRVRLWDERTSSRPGESNLTLPLEASGGVPRIVRVDPDPRPDPEPLPPAPAPLVSDIDRIVPRTPAPRPDALAVVLGVESYQTAPPATYAAQDARTAARYFEHTLGIAADRIQLLLDDEVTLAQMNRIFGEDGWLARRVHEKTEVFVFFAGHGVAALEAFVPFLIPSDGDLNYVQQTGYSLDRVIDTLASLDALQVTVFLDACFSGLTREGGALFRGGRPLVLVPVSPRLSGVSLFSAAGGTQVAHALDEHGHGLFSYYLFKGLGGGADLDRDRFVTARELQVFLEDRIPRAAARLDAEQSPSIFLESDDRPLARLP